MNKNGSIIKIEYSRKEQEIFNSIFEKLNYTNQIIFFTDAEAALEFLNNPNHIPFLILSDIKMPKLTGFELREKLKTNAALMIKCIPYLFFSSSIEQRSVIDAYSISVQGFFLKQNDPEELEKTIRTIMEYWKRCYSPNNFQHAFLSE